jgi:hypothetical protein
MFFLNKWSISFQNQQLKLKQLLIFLLVLSNFILQVHMMDVKVKEMTNL